MIKGRVGMIIAVVSVEYVCTFVSTALWFCSEATFDIFCCYFHIFFVLQHSVAPILTSELKWLG